MKANVIDVNESTFRTDVIEKSKTVPVLVDFWAPWCGPCRMLTPVLEELAAEGGGSWLLAKVNSDENPGLAQRYGVRGIPNVKAFRDGQLVDEFVGAQPKPVVKRFIEKLLPNQRDQSVKAAEALLAEGNVEKARTVLEGVLAKQPDHEAAHLALARAEFAAGQPERALSHLDAIPPKGPLGAAAESLRAQARFSNGPTAPLDTLQQRVEAEPDNLEARYELARVAVLHGNYDLAAQHLLHILERQRNFKDGAAHQAMLDLFVILGEEDERTRKYRQKLSWLLFS